MFVLYLRYCQSVEFVLSSHVLHLWDVGWQQINNRICCPSRSQTESALFSVCMSADGAGSECRIFTITEMESVKIYFGKHKNAVALRSTRNCLLHRQIRPVYAVTLLPCRRLSPVLLSHLKLHCCCIWRLLQDVVTVFCRPWFTEVSQLFRVFPAVWSLAAVRHILSKNIYSPSRSSSHLPSSPKDNVECLYRRLASNYELSVVWQSAGAATPRMHASNDGGETQKTNKHNQNSVWNHCGHCGIALKHFLLLWQATRICVESVLVCRRE